MIEIRSAGVKGLGIFATKPIRPGTRLLAETPLFTVRSERQVFAESHRLSDLESNHLKALSVHPVKKSAILGWTQAVWHALAIDHRKDAGTNRASFWASVWQYPSLLEVFRNNNFDIGNGEQAIFQDICRLNHACIPNAQGNFNQTLNKFTIHAIRTLAPGEEVTISYLHEHGALKEHRQRRLKQSYGFLCDCPACDSTTARGQEGEAKRMAMQEKLHAFAEDAEHPETLNASAELDLMKSLLAMYESEGLAGREVATIHMATAELALKLGRNAEARQHAERGLQLDKDALGDDSDIFHDTLGRYIEIVRNLK